MFSWARLEAKRTEKGDGSDSAAAFIEEIETWITEEQDSQLKRRMNDVIYDGVVRWLATRELAEQSMPTRRLLVHRIVVELEDGLKPSDVSSEFSPDEAAQLHANALLLTEAWLYEQADAYAEIEPSDRAVFIDDQIEKVQRWGVIEMVNQTDPTMSHNDPTAAMASFGAPSERMGQECQCRRISRS